MAPGGQGQDLLLLQLLQQLLGGAHLDFHLGGQAGGRDGLHPLELLHELLVAHLGDVQGADGLLHPALALGLLLALPRLLLLHLLQTFLLRHASHHMLRHVTDKSDAAGP